MKDLLNTESMRLYMFHYIYVWCKVLWKYIHWLNTYAKNVPTNVASVILFGTFLLDCEFQSDHKEKYAII